MLILASQSPRRRELLERAGIQFTVRPSGVEEVREAGESPADYVVRLARDKALAIECDPADWVLSADTTVVMDGEVLEKPVSETDARRMLRMLAGNTHEVLTGVCVRRGERLWTACEATRVRLLPLSAAEIESYLRSGEPTDKAGAYAIQGLASRFVDRIEGCYSNVVGLPVSRVWRLLQEAGYMADLG